MPDPAQAVRTALLDFGSSGDIVELPEPAPTAALTARQLGCDVGAIANGLIFSIDGSPRLVIAGGARVTGQEVGGVAPVGHPAPIRTIIDLWLDRHPRVWAGAGLPHTVFSTTFAELVKLTNGEGADISG